MKIDKANIDYNVIRMVEEVTADVWNEDMDEYSIKALLYIRGVLDLAEELKKVLDA